MHYFEGVTKTLTDTAGAEPVSPCYGTKKWNAERGCTTTIKKETGGFGDGSAS